MGTVVRMNQLIPEPHRFLGRSDELMYVTSLDTT